MSPCLAKRFVPRVPALRFLSIQLRICGNFPAFLAEDGDFVWGFVLYIWDLKIYLCKGIGLPLVMEEQGHESYRRP